MIDTQRFLQSCFEGLRGIKSWIKVAEQYPVDDLADYFFSTRAAMQRTLIDLTDAQVAYADINNPTWSLSETVTHLVYSQNGYHNMLLEISSSQQPHLVEAARGFGEGSVSNVPAEKLRESLAAATERIKQLIAETRAKLPVLTIYNQLFGEINYQTWLFLLTAHEVDHVRQSLIMRRLARAALKDPVSTPIAPKTVDNFVSSETNVKSSVIPTTMSVTSPTETLGISETDKEHKDPVDKTDSSRTSNSRN